MSEHALKSDLDAALADIGSIGKVLAYAQAHSQVIAALNAAEAYLEGDGRYTHEATLREVRKAVRALERQSSRSES